MAAFEKFGTTYMVCDSYRHMQFYPCLSIYLINRVWTRTQVSKSALSCTEENNNFQEKERETPECTFLCILMPLLRIELSFPWALHDLQLMKVVEVDFCINQQMYLCKHLSITYSRICETGLSFCWSTLFHEWQNIGPRYVQKTRAFFASLCHTSLMLLAAVAAAADSGTKKHISLPCWIGSLPWSHHRIRTGSGSASRLPPQSFLEASLATWVLPLTELWYLFPVQLRYLSMGIHCSPELSLCFVAQIPYCCFHCSRYCRCC